MFKKVAISVLAALLSLTTAVPAFADSPTIHGQAGVVIDAVSGQVLYQQNGSNKNYPASTTKLLTALVAVEHGDLNQMVKVSSNAVNQPPDSTSCYLEQGEEQSLKNLLYGMLLASGNDCAAAIAEGIGNGNVGQFITWMNETAKRVGATHSNFVNPHGLHDPNHYTTAIDLALIARAAFQKPELLQISGTKEFFWPGKSERNGIYYNLDHLLFSYDGSVAGKPGFTDEAGHTLVHAAKRDGRFLISVVMGEDGVNEYADSTALLNYGFQQFEEKDAVTNGAVITTVPVAGGRQTSVAATVNGSFPVSTIKGTAPVVTVTPKLKSSLTAPIAAGQQIGVVEIRDKDRLLGTLPVVAQQAVAVNPLTAHNIAAKVLAAVKWLAILFAGLIAFRTTVRAVRRARKRSKGYAGAYRRAAARGDSHTIDLYRTPKS